jgi:integrase
VRDAGKRRRESSGRVRFLDDSERERLLATCRVSEWPGLYPLVLLALTTGARRGELIELKWSDVDLKAGRATLRVTKNRDPRTLALTGRALEEVRAAVSDCPVHRICTEPNGAACK